MINMNKRKQQMGFGAIDEDDKSLKGSDQYAKFGLNTGYITKIEYNPNAGKDNAPSDAIDIIVTIDEKEFRNRIYDITKVYSKNNEVYDTHPSYVLEYNKGMIQVQAIVIHTIKAAGVTTLSIENALKEPPNNFKEWAEILIGLLPENFDTEPVDVFLEYQWRISPNQNRTYLRLPKNMKGGKSIIPSITPNGSWKEETEWTINNKKFSGLRYVDDSNFVHVFKRDYGFMKSNKAIQQFDEKKEEEDESLDFYNNDGNSAKETWV